MRLVSLHRLPAAGTSDNRQVFWRFAAHVPPVTEAATIFPSFLSVNMTTFQPARPAAPGRTLASTVLGLAKACYANQRPGMSERSREVVVECGGGISSR